MVGKTTRQSSRLITMLCALALAIAPLTISSCGENESSPVRQSTTTTAATTDEVHGSMEAKVNGDDWVAGGTPPETRLDDVTASVDPNSGMVTITGRKYEHHALKTDYMEEISLTLEQLKPGVFTLKPDFNNYQTATFSKGLENPTTFFMHEKQDGTVMISRVDSVSHRIYGTFHFTCADAKGHDVEVTEGAFDNVGYEPPTVLAGMSGGQ